MASDGQSPIADSWVSSELIGWIWMDLDRSALRSHSPAVSWHILRRIDVERVQIGLRGKVELVVAAKASVDKC
jgi:hypothetical protein